MDDFRSSEIMNDINRRLKREDHHILLLLDNVPCHPWDYQDSSAFFNIEVVLFPMNTTSRMQPLDVGVIQSFKCQYFKLAWHKVKEDTIIKCFKNCGVVWEIRIPPFGFLC